MDVKVFWNQAGHWNPDGREKKKGGKMMGRIGNTKSVYLDERINYLLLQKGEEKSLKKIVEKELKKKNFIPC